MNIIASIIMGAISGWIASKIMGTDRQMGAFANIIIGILGGSIGGILIGIIGGEGVTGFNPWSLFVSILGAVILIAIVKKIKD